MTESEARLILNMLPGIGSLTFKKLLGHFKKAVLVLKATDKELESCGLPRKVAESFKQRLDSVDLKKELGLIEKARAEVIFLDSPSYPKLLKEIFDPPQVLYVKGKLDPKALNIAVVGSRLASIYGLKIAEQFSYQLSSLGITIVSGLARGIDSAAHRGALKAKGRTTAVLGSGLNCIYPPENKKLFEEISESGAVISEFAMSTGPLAGNFPRRNRIISGLSSGVVVVEAAKRSGALITAGFALEQGREVFAIPGKADSPTSWGTNQLIKDGAKLVDNIEEIISDFEIGVKIWSKNTKSENGKNIALTLCEEEQAILKTISHEPINFEEISKICDIETPAILATLTKLEIKGLIKQLPGKIFILNPHLKKEE